MQTRDLSFQEKLFMVGTSMVAGFALLVSLWQGYETRRHNRLSVKPLLSYDRNFSMTTINGVEQKTYQLVLKNMGVGPAVIKGFDLYLDNKKLKKKDHSLWITAVEQGQLKIDIKQASHLSDGDVMKNAYSKSILKCSLVEKDLRRLILKIHYQSIYEEDFFIEIKLY